MRKIEKEKYTVFDLHLIENPLENTIRERMCKKTKIRMTKKNYGFLLPSFDYENEDEI